MQDPDGSADDKFDDVFTIVMTARRVELAVGCFLFFIMICDIFRRRLYVYNTIRLYLFMCVCYFVGMLIVLVHSTDLTKEKHYPDNDGKELRKILKEMWIEHKNVWCGLEGFINMFFYCLGYFFAVLITYNVHCVLNNTYRNFMRKLFVKKKVIIFLIVMFICYLVPFTTIFYMLRPNFQHYFIYGPTGFKYEHQNLILFCGPCFTRGLQMAAILVLTYGVPFFLFFFHITLILIVRKRLKKLASSEYLNSKQNFIMKSGNLGTIIFVIQAVNFGKEMISYLTSFWQVVMVINYAFDLYPFVLVFFYFRYTREKKGVSGSSTLLEQDQQ